MLTTQSKTTPKPICNFADGTIVQPLGLPHWRNLVVERVSDCSTLVKGERRDENGSFHQFTDYVANSLLVYPSGKIESSPTITVNKDIIPTPKEVGSRGRKKVEFDLSFPDEFTINDLAEIHSSVSKAVIYLRVQEAIKAGGVKRLREEKGRRGKPTVVYGIVK